MTLRMRWRPLLGAAGLMLAMQSATACNPAVGWRLGRTHGAIIEIGAQRASLGIYKAPSRALYTVYRHGGTRSAQDVLWAVGSPPIASLRVGNSSLAAAVLRYKLHGYIYGDAADFRGGLLDAHRSDDCLALTLISQGLYIKNWTHKSVGCRTGSL